jgi:DNA modification methylase
MREVRRVLRDDGTLWLNLGDSYAAKADSSKGCGALNERGVGNHYFDKRKLPGVKPKDLIGTPWRVAFALQADGWTLRSDIIWAKPNPMPESVRDRPTKSHEYIFLLSKGSKYFYDGFAIREPAMRPGDVQTFGKRSRVAGTFSADDPEYRNGSEQWGRTIQSGVNGRNRRSVWTIATQPLKMAHFATFPPKLVEPCVLAGTSQAGCCPACGAPWQRVVKRVADGARKERWADDACGNPQAHGGSFWSPVLYRQNGWRPSCSCPVADPIPCTVLDCFAGVCTTGLVARRHGRDFIGIDVNAAYLEMGRRRLEGREPIDDPPEANGARDLFDWAGGGATT